MRIKTIIIDSSEESCSDLEWNLEFFHCFEIIGRYASFEELQTLSADEEVDAAFVSLELPTSDGFYCSYYLQMNFPDTRIVMMSQCKEFAYEAYDYGLFDYIMKPLEPTRVEKTINRLKEALRSEEAVIEPPRSIMVKIKGKYRMIEFEHILFLETRAKKCYLILDDGNEVALQRYTVEQLEKMFTPFGFVRCYQSIIVQASKIAQLVSDSESRSCTMTLHGYNKSLPVSRERFQTVMGMLKEISGITITGNERHE